MGEARRVVAALLRTQASWCERLGSPLYAALLDGAASDAERGGPVSEVLDRHAGDPSGSALALRFAGAVHRIVLEGAAPALARHYPSAGGDSNAGDPLPAFLEAVAANLGRLRELVGRPVQTNEPGRSASLLGGFLAVAHATRLPLRLLEIGASAGLNLRWDRYRYEAGPWAWGDPGSPVRLIGAFEGDARPPLPEVRIAERAGCDPDPVDPATEEGRLTLESYVWPDQERRLALLRGALGVARDLPVALDRGDGPGWLGARLAEPAGGVATVVFHSVVMQYLGEEGRARLRDVLGDAARRAGRDAPLAWLRLEPSRVERGDGEFLVSLTTWPGGEERLLARTHPHGPPVAWLDGASG